MQIDNEKLNKLAKEIFSDDVVAFNWEFDDDEIVIDIVASDYSCMPLQQKLFISHAQFYLTIDEFQDTIK